MIFTRDFVTRENYWQIASLMTQKPLFTVTHALFFIYYVFCMYVLEPYAALGDSIERSLSTIPFMFKIHISLLYDKSFDFTTDIFTVFTAL